MAALENTVCERARLARDARFDGLFFIGVRTTGIYCRPICPANAPKSENIRYFQSAAAASEAGFRPCLRCRPESAPGSPAWCGTSTTVRRGLRLIEDGALEDGNIEALSDRLGVTSRHLRRLFSEHLGASPSAVAHTRRLLFAKRLINDTALSMHDISLAAGYGSVRRFNDAFRKTYGRPPRDLRKLRDADETPHAGAALTVTLPYRQPLGWHTMLGYFQHRATPGVECVDDGAYRRTVLVEGNHGILEVRPAQKTGFLALTMTGIATTSLFDAVQRTRDLFDVDAPVDEISATLEQDALLASLLKTLPGVRAPGAWDGFELAVRAILGQQVSVAGATTLAGRIARRYGVPLELSDPSGRLQVIFPSPRCLAGARFEDVGLIRSRAATIRDLARAVDQGDINFDVSQDADDFCRRLQSIRGIGDWTAQYVCMRVLKNPDAFPAADLGLLKAIAPPARVTPIELKTRAEAWRPWRAYAAFLLWQATPTTGG